MTEEWLTLVELAERFGTNVGRLSTLLRRRDLPYKWEDPPRPKMKPRLLYEVGAVAALLPLVRSSVRLTPDQKAEVTVLAEMLTVIEEAKKKYHQRRKAFLVATDISATTLRLRIHHHQRKINGRSQ